MFVCSRLQSGLLWRLQCFWRLWAYSCVIVLSRKWCHLFSHLSIQEMDQRGILLGMSVSVNLSGATMRGKSLSSVQVLNIVCVSCSLIVTRLSLKRKKDRCIAAETLDFRLQPKSNWDFWVIFILCVLWIFVLLSVSLLLNSLTQCKIKGSWFLYLSMCNYLSEKWVSLY